MKSKNPLRRLFDSRAFWTVVSLLASFAIWIYVTSADNSDFRQTFRNVRVELVGEDTLRASRNLVVTDLDVGSVTVVISGPRRIVNPMDSDDLIAQVDVSKLSTAAYTSLKYDIVYPSGVSERELTVEKKSPEYVTFNVSPLTSKEVPVRGGFEGKPDDGYTAESPVFEPSTILVTGPEAYLKDIDRAWVTFGRDMVVSSTYSTDVGFTLQNASGEPCSTEYLSCSQDTVKATLPIRAIKNVPLTVNLIYGSGANETNTIVSVTPTYLTLTGDSAILSGMNQIVLGTVDLTDFSTTFTEEYSIPLDNTLKNLTGLSTAEVTIEVVGLETRNYAVTNITCTNLPETSEVEVITESLEVRIRGTEEQLSQIHAENITAVADLSDYRDSLGAYMTPVKIRVDGFTDVGAVGDYTISVEIRKADG